MSDNPNEPQPEDEQPTLPSDDVEPEPDEGPGEGTRALDSI